MLRRGQAEARLLHRLRHPNIVEVSRVGIEDGAALHRDQAAPRTGAERGAGRARPVERGRGRPPLLSATLPEQRPESPTIMDMRWRQAGQVDERARPTLRIACASLEWLFE